MILFKSLSLLFGLVECYFEIGVEQVLIFVRNTDPQVGKTILTDRKREVLE